MAYRKPRGKTTRSRSARSGARGRKRSYGRSKSRRVARSSQQTVKIVLETSSPTPALEAPGVMPVTVASAKRSKF